MGAAFIYSYVDLMDGSPEVIRQIFALWRTRVETRVFTEDDRSAFKDDYDLEGDLSVALLERLRDLEALAVEGEGVEFSILVTPTNRHLLLSARGSYGDVTDFMNFCGPLYYFGVVELSSADELIVLYRAGRIDPKGKDGPSSFIKARLGEYVKERLPKGHFLSACLRNDLMEAVGRADAENLAQLREIMQYIYCHLPSECWGDREKVETWLRGSGEG